METTKYKKSIKVIYIGHDLRVSNWFKALPNFDAIVFSYSNPILAHHDLKHHQANCDIIVCDQKIQGLDIFSYFNKIKHLKAKKYLYGNHSISRLQQKKLKAVQIEDVFTSPMLIETLNQRLSFVFSENQLENSRKLNIRSSILKRVFDISLAVIALIVLSPILFLTAIAIKIDSKGPVFFTSKRVGKGYKVFNFYKFRTMKVGAENLIDSLKNLNQYQNNTEVVNEFCPACSKLGSPCSPILIIDGDTTCENFYLLNQKKSSTSFVKFKNDPRVTKLGEFLRKTSIDELPQLLNILKGDMSFVGNRPLPLYEAEQLTSDDWALRFMAPAGLTGLWQVRKRGKAEMSEEERKQLDNSYAKNHTFLKDILLIFQTIPALTQKENV
jgi:lipopolysaccharide/colanic/teichoic acid biosynthesis glycosyltransferase